MRIRRRLVLSSISTAALSDLQLHGSLSSDQPFDPPPRLSDQSTVNKRGVFLKNDETEGKMKGKEFGDDDDERWSLEWEKNSNDDIRKIVSICDCDGEDGTHKVLLPSSSSSKERNSWCEEDYKTAPLKKRKGRFERNPEEEEIRMDAKMKSKTNKKLGDRNGGIAKKPCKRESVIMEGSQCSRVNGRGWRCCQPTLVGYSLCEHHLGKGRLRSKAPSELKRRSMRAKAGAVKARSMSSLLSQI